MAKWLVLHRHAKRAVSVNLTEPYQAT